MFALLTVLLFSNQLETGRPYVSAKSSSSAGTWSLSVSVIDQFGETVQGQEIQIQDNLGEGVYNGHTNGAGQITVKLEAGEYTVYVQGHSYTLDLNKDSKIEATVTVDLPIAVEGAS